MEIDVIVRKDPKKYIVYLIIRSFLFLIMLFATLFGYKAFKLNVFHAPDCTETVQLTDQQRIEDIEFFIDFVKQSYPFAEAVRDEKGLEYFFDHEQEFMSKARSMKDNKDFIDLFDEMIQRVKQGTGHADIIWPSNVGSLPQVTSFCTMYNIHKNSLHCQEYWCSLLDVCNKYVHTDIRISYKCGEYIIDEEFNNGSCFIPKHSIIEQIDGRPIDQFVNSLQDKTWLRFDANLNKSYAHHPSPFLVCESNSDTTWSVELRSEDNKLIKCQIPKKAGFRANPHFANSRCSNECIKLTSEVGYLRIPFFPDCDCLKDDLDKLNRLFNEDEGIKKLIVDLRGNYGGIQKYGEELLIRPFIEEPVHYTQYSAIKKHVFNQLRFCYNVSKITWRCDLNPGQISEISMKEIPYDISCNDIDPEAYYFFRNTKTFYPNEDTRFTGEVYYLIDNDCFSSAEDLIRAVKQLGIGTLVGARSRGGAAAFFPPWYFELPNSKVIFLLEIEMAFNPDGTINEIYGTQPDIELATSTYPTELPASYENDDLLKDKWIRWIMHNR